MEKDIYYIMDVRINLLCHRCHRLREKLMAAMPESGRAAFPCWAGTKNNHLFVGLLRINQITSFVRSDCGQRNVFSYKMEKQNCSHCLIDARLHQQHQYLGLDNWDIINLKYN